MSTILDIMTSMHYIVAMDTVPTCPSRFTGPVFLWAIAALITELAVEWFPNHVLHQTVPRLLTLLPLIPAMFFWVALVRTIQRMDELQKRIWYESVFIAFMATLALTFIFAGLERAGIRRAPWDDIGSSMMLIWGCA
jgi:cytochrome c oxidase assembly factor CtaG